MTDVTSFPNMQDIELEAAEWAVRLDRAEVSAELLADFRAWCSQSKQHRDAAERFCDLWAGTEVLDAFNDLAETQVVSEPRKIDSTARRRRTWRQAMTGGLTASLLAVAGLVAYQAFMTQEPSYNEAFLTEVGEQRTLELPDGSTVVLNTDSYLQVDFSKKERRLRLERGEAFFDVAHDPARVFSVNTDRGIVTAVGTAFLVRVQDERINVLVTEGRVALTSVDVFRSTAHSDTTAVDTMTTIMEVSAGQSAVYNQRVEDLNPIAPDAIERQLDWRDGLLSFNGEPLSEVVAEISRYTDTAIEIDDAELAARRVVAIYRVGSIEPMFEALRLTANVEVERIEDGRIRLYQAR